MKFYKITDKALVQYRLNTKSNRNITKFNARRKLSRNIALATLYSEDDVFQEFSYGNLFIRVIKDKDLVCDVHTEFTYNPVPIDQEQYERVSREFGLEV